MYTAGSCGNDVQFEVGHTAVRSRAANELCQTMNSSFDFGSSMPWLACEPLLSACYLLTALKHLPPIVGLYLSELPRFPVAGPSSARNCNLNIKAPRRQTLLAQPTWSKYQKGLLRRAPRNAHRRSDPQAQSIGFTNRARLMAQIRDLVGAIKADACQDLPIGRRQCSGAGVAGWKSRQRLLNRCIH